LNSLTFLPFQWTSLDLVIEELWAFVILSCFFILKFVHQSLCCSFAEVFALSFPIFLLFFFTFLLPYISYTKGFHGDISIHAYNVLWPNSPHYYSFSLLSHLKIIFNRFHYSISIRVYKLPWPLLPSPVALSPPAGIYPKVPVLYSCPLFLNTKFCIREKTCNICLSQSVIFLL
jgi:hypothetical protein